MHYEFLADRPSSGVQKMREGGSGTRLRQEALMIAGGREVPDPAQATWACQEVQEPENVGSGFTGGVETVAVDCGGVAAGTTDGVETAALGCDGVAAGTTDGVETEGVGCDGTRELMTWSRGRPSQGLLRTKSCSTFWVPIDTCRVWKTVPLKLAVIWYRPGLSAIWYPPALQVCVDVVCPVVRFVASICTPPVPSPISYMPVCWLS